MYAVRQLFGAIAALAGSGAVAAIRRSFRRRSRLAAKTVSGLWQRIANLLKSFPKGVYLSDNIPNLVHHEHYKYLKLAKKLLEFVRQGEVFLHFQNEKETEETLLKSGFQDITVHEPESYYETLPIPPSKGLSNIRVIEAKV